jgi:hypothetical protein
MLNVVVELASELTADSPDHVRDIQGVATEPGLNIVDT